MVFLKITNLIENVVQSLAGKIVTIERYQAALGRNKCGPGIKN